MYIIEYIHLFYLYINKILYKNITQKDLFERFPRLAV